MAQENISVQLNDLLASRDFQAELLDKEGRPTDAENADIFTFDYVSSGGKNYGTMVIILDTGNEMQVFYGDNLGRSMEGDDKTEFFDFVQHLHKFANMRRWTYSPKNINQVKYTMQGLAAIKEGLFEGYYGTRKVSYSGEPTEARLVIQHNRTLGETDARFRYVESLFIETADSERYRLQFKNLAGGRAMLEHVRQGGRPYDVRGSHITEMVSEIATLSRFNRASAGRVLEGVTAELVTEAQQYYRSLRENLKRMAATRGYQTYFESWHPAETTLQEELVDSIKTMFVEQTLDSRIEAALPVLARLQQENRMKEADIFESWADNLSEGTWALPDTPEKHQRLQDLMSRELIVGPDATNATSQLDDLVGDDRLFDYLESLADRDASANVWDDTDVQARLGDLGIQLPGLSPEDDADDVAANADSGVGPQQPMNEGRVKELEMDIADSLMSDEEFETKYGESRGVMARELGLVQDRKTGRFYDPDQEFDRLKNSPEFGTQMRRMTQRDGVAEGLPQTLRKIVPGYAKREIDKKMDAQKFGRTDVDKDANYYRYKKIQDKIKEQGRFAGDTRVDIGGTTLKKIESGDTVSYFGEKARAVDVDYAKNYARITANGKTLNVKLSDLKRVGGSVAETALRDKADLVAKRRALQDLSRDPGVDQKAVQQRQQDLEKEAKAKGLAESVKSAASRRKINESLLMEDPIYRNFKQVGRYIAERRMSEKEILQVFADAEAGMTSTATGSNRTMLGRGKDKATDLAASIRDSVGKVLSSIQNSVPVSAVDTAYDQATDAVAGLAGGQKGQVMQAIKKYRMLVKKYPKSAGFAKAALVAITGLATGGASLPAIAGLTYALDAAVKGEKLSSVLGKGAGAAALAWAGQAISGAMGSDPAAAGTDPVSNLVSPDKFPTADLPTYTVQSGDTLSQIARDNGVSVQDLVGLNPQLADATGATGGQSMNPDVIFPGQEITLPPASGAGTYAGGVGTNAGTQADIASGQIPDSEISRRLAGDVGATPSAGPAGDAATTTSAAQSPASAPTGSSNTFTGTMIANEPVIPGQPLSAKQVKIVDLARSMGNSYSPEVMQSYNLAKGIKESSLIVAKIRESVQHKILPFEQLIDQKRTEMAWTLNESIGRKNNSFVLSAAGIHAVFENVDRYRQAMLELAGVPGSTRPAQYRPDMPGAAATSTPAKKPGLLSRGLSKVGGALGTFGRQFTTNVTKEKLKMNWHQAGKPSDSDQLATWLVKQGVPQDVVTPIYKKMGLPVTATSTQLAPQPTAQPVTQPVLSPATATTAPAPAATKPAATTAAPTAAPTAAKPAATAPASFNAGNVMNLPGMEKYAKPKTANFAGPSGYGQTTMGFKSPTAAPAAATKQPAAPVPAPAAATPANVHAKKGPGPTAAEKDKLEKLIAQAKAKEMTESLLAEFAADLDSDDLAEDTVAEAKMSPQQQNDFDRMRYGAMSRKEYDARWKKPKKSDDQVIYGKKPSVAEAGTCNHTMEGEMCPEHGLAECGMHESKESDADLARLKSLAHGK